MGQKNGEFGGMVLNTKVKIEDLAKATGEKLARDLKSLKYWRFDSSTNSFVNHIPFMDGAKTQEEIRERRNTYTAEMMFVDAIAKHIAMITAPTKEDKMHVMDAWYDDIRIDRENTGRFTNVATDNYGFEAGLDLAKKKKDYDDFVTYQNVICDCIERELPKVELPKEISLDLIEWNSN